MTRDYQSYNSIEQIKNANEKANKYFFSKNTMKFFNSRVLPDVIYGKYFITSEKLDENPRRYTIRRIEQDGSISNVSKFGQFFTAQSAREYAKQLS